MTMPMIDESRLSVLLRTAVGSRAGTRLEQVDPEDVALLTSGRLDEVPGADRAALLDAIAGDPSLARLVADLSLAGVMERSADPRRIHRRRQFRLALAACAVVAFGLVSWRLLDPPGAAVPPSSVTLMDPDRGVPHPVDAALATGTSWTPVDFLRDGVLLVALAGIACLAWPALRDLDKPVASSSRRSVR